jgi:putative membrane protein
MFIGFLIIWIISSIGLMIVTRLVPGVKAESSGALMLAAFILGLMNAIIRPLLFALTFPLTVLTFGLFALVINALMIKLTAALVPGFEVDSFGSALLAALTMVFLAVLGFMMIQFLLLGSILFW